MAAEAGPAPLYLVRGDDPALVAQEARALLGRLVGDRDPALVVEEHGGSAAEDLDVGAVVDAFTTPPFLVDRRVVVVREAGRLTATDATRLTAALADPPPSNTLVLVAGGGTVPQGLVKAAGSAGQVLDVSVKSARDRSQWMAEHLRRAPVRLEGPAAQRLGQHLGEDLGRLAGILGTLATAYGEGATVGLAELEPFLGEAGSLPPWDLTDAIDQGRPDTALAVLHRMLGAGERAPLEILAIVHRHVSQLLRLDGADVVTPEEAAALLGLRSPFPAKKALEQSRRLGGERIRQAVALVGRADRDLRGESGLPPELVLEILVARLSRLTRARQPSRR